MIEITGEALYDLLMSIERVGKDNVNKITIDPRGERHLAFKVNEYMWSPTLDSK